MQVSNEVRTQSVEDDRNEIPYRGDPEGWRFLNASTLARIGNLELVAKFVVEGFISGLHKSPYHGFSVEFPSIGNTCPAMIPSMSTGKSMDGQIDTTSSSLRRKQTSTAIFSLTRANR